MVDLAARSLDQRRADTLAAFLRPAVDAWVSTASAAGEPYLVPLSFTWFDERVVLATEAASRTVRNLVERPRARLGLGPTRDVVLIDAHVEQIVPLEQAGDIADGYAAQADWDPRSARGEYVYLVLCPQRIQAWREVDEIPGRTLMQDGRWIV